MPPDAPPFRLSFISSAPARAGRPTKLSDSALACLAVAQVLLGARSKHHCLPCATPGSVTCFLSCSAVRLPQVSQGLRAAAGRGIDFLARSACPAKTSCGCSTPPRAVRRARGRPRSIRARRVGGLLVLRGSFALVLRPELYLSTTPDWMPVVWCLASPKIDKRQAAADLLVHARSYRCAAAWADPDRGLGLRCALTSWTWSPVATACSWLPLPPRRFIPPRLDLLNPPVYLIG